MSWRRPQRKASSGCSLLQATAHSCAATALRTAARQRLRTSEGGRPNLLKMPEREVPKASESRFFMPIMLTASETRVTGWVGWKAAELTMARTLAASAGSVMRASAKSLTEAVSLRWSWRMRMGTVTDVGRMRSESITSSTDFRRRIVSGERLGLVGEAGGGMAVSVIERAGGGI